MFPTAKESAPTDAVTPIAVASTMALTKPNTRDAAVPTAIRVLALAMVEEAIYGFPSHAEGL